MTGHYHNTAHESRPNFYRETSAFLMKAYYQRHMLYGWTVTFNTARTVGGLVSSELRDQ